MPYTIGLDYGTNSVRCLVANVADGREVGTAVYEYESGHAGVLLDPADHNVARQNPADYLKGLESTILEAVQQAKINDSSFESANDLPVDAFRFLAPRLETTGLVA